MRTYHAHAAVTAERDASGRTRLTRLRSDGPLAVRETGEAVYLVGAAAGPLGGDELELDLEVGPGAVAPPAAAAASPPVVSGVPSGAGVPPAPVTACSPMCSPPTCR